MRTLKRSVDGGEVRGSFEAAIVSFCDSVERTAWKKRLAVRVAEGALWRLMGPCWHVGGLDGEASVEPELGTAPGAVLSALWGNVALHSGLAQWCETEVTPRLQGQATLMRSGDDCIIGFAREDDARRVMAVLGQR